jgi:hypothetical protein
MTRDHDQLIDAHLSQHSQGPLNERFTFNFNQPLGPAAETTARSCSQHYAAEAQPAGAAVTRLTAGVFGHTTRLFRDHR